MVQGPLPGEQLLPWPHSQAARDLMRFTAWLGAIVWFFAPPFLVHTALPPSVAFWVAASLSAIALFIWVLGFIVLGRLVRGLAPLPDPHA